jgi:MoaA/NifB/PqqE/SkfB family radical SAM enzyme
MELPSISLSINPTYLCNFRCDFCYLTPDQLADTKKVSISKIENLLEEIQEAGYKVDHVDLYGGEVGLLPEAYLKDLDNLLFYTSNPSIGVITNLYKINPYFLEPDIQLSVSFDFDARERHDIVMTNMVLINKPLSILMLASPKLMSKDVDYMIRFFNQLANVISVEIKPYSSNQANILPVTDKDFEEFVKRWITSPIKKNFTFVNESNIKECLNESYNAYSDNHIYITPSGKFAVLEFDQEGHELFMELDSFQDYIAWTKTEKQRVQGNEICNQCPYLGKCLTEHYRDVKTLENSCNGFRHLLDWANQNLKESKAP